MNFPPRFHHQWPCRRRLQQVVAGEHESYSRRVVDSCSKSLAPRFGKAKVAGSTPAVGSTNHATAETPGFQPIPRRNIASKAVASSGREK